MLNLLQLFFVIFYCYQKKNILKVALISEFRKGARRIYAFAMQGATLIWQVREAQIVQEERGLSTGSANHVQWAFLW